MHSINYKRFETSAIRAVLALIVAAGLVFAVGCGGGGSSLTANPTPTPNNSASSTQVRIGDAPADSVIAFEVSLTALSLTPSGGGAAVSIPVGANNRIELSHQSGKFEPLALGNLPQGSFTSASLTLANSELTFMTGTGPVHINGPASAQVTVNLSPALSIGSSPTILAIDVNVANSITTNAGGAITGISFGPTSFTITAKAPGAQAGQQDDDGEIEDVRGTVTASTSSNFTLKVGQTGSSMTFNFDASTKFSDGATAATLLNQIVSVEGFTKSDGSLFATEVEGQEASTGSELEGMIRSISGTLLTVTAHDGSGSGMDDTKVGVDFTVSINGLAASKFRVDGGNGFGSLVPNTLSFSATNIHAGQQIEVESNSPVPAANGSITADKLKLQQQGVSGTAANVAASTFDINLAADSALAVISGQTVVHVTKVSATDTRKTVSNGTAVQVRGLLFWNGTSWQLIARRIR